MKKWGDMSYMEKCIHIINTKIGVTPCDEACLKCPIGFYRSPCGDDVAQIRAKRWLKKYNVQP